MTSDRIIDKYQRAHDQHLDAAAKLRRYDSIYTAALRAAFQGPYHDEGVAYATWMEACNEVGYSIRSRIESGDMQPITVDEYIALLPALVLP